MMMMVVMMTTMAWRWSTMYRNMSPHSYTNILYCCWVVDIINRLFYCAFIQLDHPSISVHIRQMKKTRCAQVSFVSYTDSIKISCLFITAVSTAAVTEPCMVNVPVVQLDLLRLGWIVGGGGSVVAPFFFKFYSDTRIPKIRLAFSLNSNRVSAADTGQMLRCFAKRPEEHSCYFT